MDTLPLFSDADFCQAPPALVIASQEREQPGASLVLTYEQFATMNGASRQDIGDAAFHNPAGHMPVSTWRRMVAQQAAKDRALIVRRAELQIEYDAKVAAGEIRPPSHREQTIARARGHEDNDSVQAARRICARRGWEWREATEEAAA